MIPIERRLSNFLIVHKIQGFSSVFDMMRHSGIILRIDPGDLILFTVSIRQRLLYQQGGYMHVKIQQTI